MEKVVITIARQYGSGGRTVGEMLAERLGIHFYNKELMKLASEESGINEALFVNADEKAKGSRIFGNTPNVYSGELIPPESNELTSNDNLSGLRIRKLTPKECFRLMGFDDADFEKASQHNSNSQLYKQAGNSIVVDVLAHIFTQML